MCPPGYHHNGFVATHALGHMMYGWSTWWPLIYIYIYIYIYINTKKNCTGKMKLEKDNRRNVVSSMLNWLP